MTYREYIYKICTEADLDDKDEIIELLQFLASEATRSNDVSNRFDKKLQELMTAKDYATFVKDEARKLWEEGIERMPEGEFKDFCMARAEEVTGKAFKQEEQGNGDTTDTL